MMHINQRHSSDCGIACLAMCTSGYYEDALVATFRNYRRKRVYKTRAKDLIEGAEWLGFIAQNFMKSKEPWSAMPLRSIARVRPDKNRNGWHWVAFNGVQVLDPCLDGPVFLEDYPFHPEGYIAINPQR